MYGQPSTHKVTFIDTGEPVSVLAALSLCTLHACAICIYENSWYWYCLPTPGDQCRQQNLRHPKWWNRLRTVFLHFTCFSMVCSQNRKQTTRYCINEPYEADADCVCSAENSVQEKDSFILKVFSWDIWAQGHLARLMAVDDCRLDVPLHFEEVSCVCQLEPRTSVMN